MTTNQPINNVKARDPVGSKNLNQQEVWLTIILKIIVDKRLNLTGRKYRKCKNRRTLVVIMGTTSAPGVDRH